MSETGADTQPDSELKDMFPRGVGPRDRRSRQRRRERERRPERRAKRKRRKRWAWRSGTTEPRRRDPGITARDLARRGAVVRAAQRAHQVPTRAGGGEGSVVGGR